MREEQKELEEIEHEDRTFASDSKAKMDLGIEVSNISRTLAEKYDIDPEINGVLITDIDRKSNAYNAGIRVGDVITRVGTKQVNSTSEFRDLVKNAEEQESLLLLVRRGDRSSYFAFEID